MSNDIEHPQNPRNGKVLAGIILLALGGILLFKQLDFFFIPSWLFTWPMWLIFIGLFIGAKCNFQKPSSIILIILGVVFLLHENLHEARGVVWPVAIIAFGLWMILRRRSSFDNDYWQKRHGHKWDWRNPNPTQNPNDPAVDYTTSTVPPKTSSTYPPTGDDYLDAVSIFGGVKKDHSVQGL